jgi:hypothetical protein
MFAESERLCCCLSVNACMAPKLTCSVYILHAAGHTACPHT